MSRSVVRIFGGIALLAVASAASPAATANDAAAALSVTLEVEQTLLNEDLRKYRALTGRRDDTVTRLAQLEQALDVAVGDQRAAESGRLEQLVDQVARAVAERRLLFTSELQLVERIGDRRRQVALLAQQLEKVRGTVEERPEGRLTGSWDLVLLPVEQRGVAKIRQEGAVVTGTYELAGGWTGSLQGTLVDRKVFLIRIDSKLGRMMEFEGYLSRDGNRITGTWLNYELSGTEGSTGQFSAERRDAAP